MVSDTLQAPGPGGLPQQGRLLLEARSICGRTALSRSERSEPFVVGPASYRQRDRPEVIVQNVGPGLLPGDSIETSIVVQENARLVVRGQSATKLYPCAVDESIRADVSLVVAENAELVYLPGEIIPFRDAAALQTTHLKIGSSGKGAVQEIVTTGRIARGENACFRRLDVRLRIEHAGRLLLQERALLEPALRSLHSIGRHLDYPVAATLYLVGYDAEIPVALDGPGFIAGSGANGALIIVRLLARTTQIARETMQRFVP